ncbi:hypothetical protein EMIT0P395_110033 [Pseudomonas sp. IT-P395]
MAAASARADSVQMFRAANRQAAMTDLLFMAFSSRLQWGLSRGDLCGPRWSLFEAREVSRLCQEQARFNRCVSLPSGDTQRYKTLENSRFCVPVYPPTRQIHCNTKAGRRVIEGSIDCTAFPF